MQPGPWQCGQYRGGRGKRIWKSAAKYWADKGLDTKTVMEAEGGREDPVKTCATSFRLDIRLHQAS